jgi:hypothetical protein
MKEGVGGDFLNEITPLKNNRLKTLQHQKRPYLLFLLIDNYALVYVLEPQLYILDYL